MLRAKYLDMNRFPQLLKCAPTKCLWRRSAGTWRLANGRSIPLPDWARTAISRLAMYAGRVSLRVIGGHWKIIYKRLRTVARVPMYHGELLHFARTAW